MRRTAVRARFASSVTWASTKRGGLLRCAHVRGAPALSPAPHNENGRQGVESRSDAPRTQRVQRTCRRILHRGRRWRFPRAHTSGPRLVQELSLDFGQCSDRASMVGRAMGDRAAGVARVARGARQCAARSHPARDRCPGCPSREAEVTFKRQGGPVSAGQSSDTRALLYSGVPCNREKQETATWRALSAHARSARQAVRLSQFTCFS